MRRHRVRLLPGDLVIIEMSPHDLSKGRIVYHGPKDRGGGGAGVPCPIAGS